MAVNRLEDRQKIFKILDHLISTKYEIKVLVKGDGNPYNSRIIKSEQNRPSMTKGANSIIIIEKLQPDKGNNFIQTSDKVVLKFLLSEQPCSCPVNYIGISSMPPFFGYILSAPEIIEVAEKRREKRVVFEPLDFQLAEIFFRKGTKEERRYELKVIDYASHGLRILVPQKHLDLINIIKIGDILKDIHFYAPNALLVVDGIIRHITRVDEGQFQGCYYIGIESKEIIQTSKFQR